MADDAQAVELIPLDKDLPGPIILRPDQRACVGRDDDCQIVVRAERMSRRHAEVRWENDGWCVTDLGSRNGTSINGWRVDPEVPVLLHDGDRLAFARHAFKVGVPSERDPREAEASDPYVTRASIFEGLRSGRLDRELSWALFNERYGPVIRRYSQNAGLSPQDADDVVQEVLMGFFRASDDFEYDPGKGRFRGYLKRATHNAIRNIARRPNPAQAVSQTFLDARPDDVDNDWDLEWSDQLFARATQEARRRVDRKTFDAFELYAQRGVPPEAVAEQLGLSTDSVYQAKRRVLRLIQSVVGQMREEEG